MQSDLPRHEYSERVQYSIIFRYIVSKLEEYFIYEAFCFFTIRAYFALSLLNVISELLDEGKQDNLHILGCQTLAKFIYNQASLFLIYYYLIHLNKKELSDAKNAGTELQYWKCVSYSFMFYCLQL